jgi:hypothetical protein
MTEDQEIAQSIEINGWHAIAVEDGETAFVYTCGLQYKYEHPDLVVFGLNSKTAYAILSPMIESIKNGSSFLQDGPYEGILNVPISLRAVHESQHEIYFGYSMGHRRFVGQAGTLIVRQVFWPDKNGHFPFEIGCDQKVCQLQPRLELIAFNEDREI